ncbi:MAG: DUF3617 domain-containing protein [Candidatus Thiodiazotropha sp. (ex Epidulcina cf. delphinae)]|nr:DUF3617 domain-containing protein [Candidatus Thiodiazotropha sp. (ex Epidulcina cf. delphinae)]
MKLITAATALLALNALNSAANASDINMNPGLWKWTAVIEMPGMPMQPPPSSYTTCITKADFVPKGNTQGQSCKTIDLQTEGDKVSWNITCTRPGSVTTSQGDITYHGDTAEGVIHITTQGMQMTSRTTGERLGSCKK